MSGGLAQSRDRWMRVLVITWSLVGIGLLLTAAGWLLGRVSSALVPFMLAIVIVFLFRSPVAALERRGMKRGLAVGLCYLVGFIVLGTIIAFIVPPLVDQVRQFVEAFPSYYERANTMLLDMQNRYQALVLPPWFQDAAANLQDTIARQSAEWSAVLARELFSVGGSAVTLLGTGVVALVVGFWVLKDLPTINEEMLLLAGDRRREEARVITGKVSRILGGYLRGQLMLSTATAIIVTIGLSVFGVPYSLVIGLLAGILNVIPWVGPALTAVIAGISAAFVSPWLILAGVGTSVVAQQITEIFVQPRVMSEQVDLHPLLVILSLLVGGVLFGFAGLVLAIPVAAISKGLFVYYFEKYTDSTLASEEGALFRTRVDCDPGDIECVPAEGSDAQGECATDKNTHQKPEER
jgi:predicted PurR-regulated permease PerM